MAIWALVSGLYNYYTSESTEETGDLCNFGPISTNSVNYRPSYPNTKVKTAESAPRSM